MRFRRFAFFQKILPLRHFLLVLVVLSLAIPGQKMEAQGKTLSAPRLQDTQPTEDPSALSETQESTSTPTPTTTQAEVGTSAEGLASLSGSMTL